jgi:hypothetical protein
MDDSDGWSRGCLGPFALIARECAMLTEDDINAEQGVADLTSIC